ncbi:hypothetical protein BCF59_0249 [Mycoplasmopsis mustelae]|uniref:Trigger factor n=1 Tax=Mycoplasmopsis mustelae TaxID=171289 RepID=A0A4R7UED7_9BACT|nr:hypothetical protein [Mycoplasmopsis mustelae]TDV24291.1 hypothetical protein BCF59_0249 [Mycoplasmopsis mustelae]
MRSKITSIVVQKNQWINNQNLALKFLNEEKKQKKVTQKDILDFALRGVVTLEREKLFRENVQNRDSGELHFMPIIENVEMNLESLSFDLKTYYLPKGFLDKINFDFQPQEFKLTDSEERINDFIENYIQKYQLRKYRKEGKIQENDHVVLLITDVKANLEQKFELIANSKDAKTLEAALLNKELDAEFDFEINQDTKKIKILGVFFYTNEKLTDANVIDLGIEKVQTIAQLREFMHQNLTEEVVVNSIFKYGVNVLLDLKKHNPKLLLPKDLIESDIKGFNFTKDFEGNKEQIVRESLEDFYWLNAVALKFNLFISSQELNEEVQRVQLSINPVMLNQIDTKKIADAILFQKVGAVYLAKYQPEEFEKIQKYLNFK